MAVVDSVLATGGIGQRGDISLKVRGKGKEGLKDVLGVVVLPAKMKMPAFDVRINRDEVVDLDAESAPALWTTTSIRG